MPRIATPLSDTKIKRAKPKDKMYKMFDGEGLYIEIKPTGRKVWRVKYRYGSKEKTYNRRLSRYKSFKSKRDNERN
ncbi:MAG: integrase arm-type DNA-binding domain-containing protein [Nautiliaceae bacterium]